jgi:hypothetical protein
MGYSVLDYVTIGFLLFGAGLVAHGTIFKNGLGINFRLAECPRCSELPRFFRHPRTLSQAIFGGWTCRGCGCEFDRWGREIATGEKWSSRISQLFRRPK